MCEADDIKHLQDSLTNVKFTVLFNQFDPSRLFLRRHDGVVKPAGCTTLDEKMHVALLAAADPIENLSRFVSFISEVPDLLDDEVWSPVMQEMLINEYVLKKLIRGEDHLMLFNFHSPIAKTMVMFTRYNTKGSHLYQIPLSDSLIKKLNPN